MQQTHAQRMTQRTTCSRSRSRSRSRITTRAYATWRFTVVRWDEALGQPQLLPLCDYARCCGVACCVLRGVHCDLLVCSTRRCSASECAQCTRTRRSSALCTAAAIVSFAR
jgi:hypothetical protein